MVNWPPWPPSNEAPVVESFSEKGTHGTHAYGALEKTLSERIAGLEQKENGNKMNCKSVCRLWKSIFTLHSQLFSSLLSALKTALALKMCYWQFSVASTVSPECSTTWMGQFPTCKLKWDLLRTSVTACTIDENTFSAPFGIFYVRTEIWKEIFQKKSYTNS